jgi:C-terminal processing protease CtpA/Prc
MKRFIPVSLALHLGVLAFVTSMEPQSLQDKVEIELTGDGDKAGRDVNVIENVQENGDEASEKKNYYYGIGVSGYYKNGAYIIEQVYSGYSAESAGLRSGDMIELVNGLSPMLEDISGNGPRELELTILRNGLQILIKTRRVKVFY